MKLFLSDFDGTIVEDGVLDAVAEINGIKNASEKLRAENIANDWKTTAPLVNLINSFNGISKAQIKAQLDKNNFLVKGAKELFAFLKSNGYVTVLHTGNILPVAEYYKDLFGIDYLVCPKPKMNGNVIVGITADDIVPNFKMHGCKEIIEKLRLDKKDIFVIGDSIVDLPVFELAGHRIAINTKEGIEKHADFEIKNHDLSEAINFLKRF